MTRSWSERQIVQFPHPGGEHRPKTDVMPWNRSEHKRKFLVGDGRRFEHGRLIPGPFAFWGEWEPPSRVVQRFDPVDGRPATLQSPFWTRERHRALLQNTDPLVFGDRFLYSNCRQGHNVKLQTLAPGSLILFGSKAKTGFILDTVFVVAERGSPYMQAAAESVDAPAWVREVVFGPLSRGRGDPGQRFVLYRGQRHDDPDAGPYSFVPCRALDAPDLAFARPTIHLPKTLLNPNLAMGAKASLASMRDVEDVWADVVDQVHRADLALGVDLVPPPLDGGRPIDRDQGTAS